MRKGEEGDCMYILFQGEVGIYVTSSNTEDSEEKCVAILKDNKIFGERALDTDERRGATVIAHHTSICLILNKKDYKDIIYVRIITIICYSTSNLFKNLKDSSSYRVYPFSKTGLTLNSWI